MEKITIGEIIKAQGIKGEVKIKPLTDDILRYKKLKQIIVCEVTYDIKSMRFNDGFVYIALSGINDRTAAEKLIGKEVEIARIHAVDLPENVFFISDIIGCGVFYENGYKIGDVDYVYQNGAADVYEVVGERRKLMFPFLNKIIISIDIENKKIIVDEKEFGKVVVYED